MGRWGSTENDPDHDESEDDTIDWSALRRPVKRVRIRLKPKAITLAKKRVRLRSAVLSEIGAEQSKPQGIKEEIIDAIKNDPDILTRELKRRYPSVSLVLLFAMKVEVRKQLKRSGRL